MDKNIKLKLTHDVHLDFLRWFSALCVVITHVRSMVLVPYQDAEHNILSKFFYFITGFGHQAVIVFFVISGYLVGTSAVNAVHNKNLKIYITNRFSRIYTVLIPALVLTYLLDSIGNSFYPELYSNKIILSALNFNVVENTTLQNAVFNALNLQGVISPCFGSNSPLWSLAIEWWCYILFPALISHPKYSIPGLALVIIFSINDSMFLFYGGVWMVGYFVRHLRLIFSPPMKFSLIVFFSSLIYSRFISSWAADLFVAIGAVAVIISSSHNTTCSSANIINYVNEKLASISYSSYASHFPMLLASVSILNHYGFSPLSRNLQNGGLHLVILILLFLFFYSALFHFLFESRTLYVRKFITRMISA